MAQRYDIIRIDFQANARGANAAIESLRRSAEECNERVTKLKQDLKDGIKMGKSTEEIERIRQAISGAQKESRQFSKAYNELAKGMRTLDTAIKAFNDGSLNQMSQAFQKAANNAAKLTRTKLDPMSDSYKEDYRQLTALMDATQQNYARMQGDAQQMIRTLKDGGKVAVSALQEELTAQRELKLVLSETDKGYQRTVKNIAVLEQYLRAMGGDYEFVHKNISDTKKVSDDMLRSMYGELQKTNAEGKVTKDILRENATAMREIRAEQARRVENVLGGNLGKQSEGAIRTAIANARELLTTYKTNSREAQTLSAQIVNAEEHLKTHGIEAARTAARETAAIKTQEEAEKQLQATMKKRLGSLSTLSSDALAETRKYWEAQRNGAEQGTAAFKKAEEALKKISNQQRSRRVSELDSILGDPSKHGVSDVRSALQEMEQLRDSVQKGIPVWQHYNKMVEQGRAYLDGLAKNEAAERIGTQMQNLTRLSAAGLAEVKKYWEAQYAGAERGTKAYQDAEAALKRITNLEKTRQEAQANRVLNNVGSYGDAEIRKAIQAMEQLRDAQAHGSKLWEMYNSRVEKGKKYLEEWANTDSVIKMEARMAKLPQLSDAAMAETKKFWETMVAGAEKGSKELREYEAHLQRITQEENERRQLSNEITVQRLDGNLSDMSEKEIREAIEAGKQLIQTYKTASPEAEALAKKIVNAEEHLKQYGLSAEQAARKEAAAIAEAAKKRKEADDLMKQQLQQGTSLSQSALKAQEQYWQRLIDDPKTAASSLQEYQKNLDEVHWLQKRMMQEEGVKAYKFFQNGSDANASADDVKKQADALKKFRDSLPQKSSADLIKEIDTYLARVGATSQKAAEQAMSLKDALRIGAASGNGSFSGTVEQLKQAKKTLEELQQKAIKGGYAWRRMQEGIDSINLELRRTSFISKEVQAILDAPKGKSFNELKQAVEQGRAALQNMRRTTEEERKDFDELAKKVKEADIQMKALGSSSKGTASAFDKAWSRLKTYIGLYVGAAVAMQKLTATMGDLMELSDKMGEVQKTTNFSADAVGHLTEELKKLDTRTPITNLLDLSVAAGQLGLKTQEDVQGFTEAANKLMVALPEMGKEGATEMMKVALATGEIDKIRKQMEEGLIDGSSATAVAMEKVGSTIDRLRASSAATAPAITDFVKRVGAVGAQSGISIDQVAALGSTVDALGMRVEMSATALSRMIPAIRNNSFDIAKVIGVTPDVIRNLFDAGRGMEVVLMILQHIKDSGMDADSIEGMLGMGNMKEIMKELNQMGARAGIVFSGLSQNVDELRRQLGIAAEAYEENIAIQKEYNKMNETTAAKWARLKNQLEEMFVGDAPQRLLGDIIDGLRYVVDFISGNLNPVLNFVSGILKTMLVTWTAFKIGLGEGIFVKAVASIKSLGQSIALVTMYTKDYIVAKWALVTAHTAEEKAAAKAKLATVGLNKAMKANIIMAVVAAVGYLAIKLYEVAKRSSQTGKAIADLEKEIRKETDAVDKLFYATGKTNNALQESKKRYEEVKKAGADTTEAEKQMQKASAAHASSIREINSTYGKYLGFMLSETSSAAQLAKARELINAKLRETITLKQREAALGNVEQEYGGETNRRMARLDDVIRQFTANRLDMNQQAKLSVDIAQAAQDYAQDNSKFQSEVSRLLKALNLNTKGSGGAGSAIMSAAKEYQQQLQKIANAEDLVDRRFNAQDTTNRKKTREATVTTLNQTLADWRDLLGKFQKAEGEEKGKLAAEVYKQQRAYANLLSTNSDYLANDKRKAQLEQNVKNMKTWEKSLRSVAGEAIRAIDAMERAETKVTGTDYTQGGESADNPWGTPLSAESLDYANMNAEELVRRRKQMAKFVNAIQTDTDVQSVLAEDKALKAAIEKGMSSDMRTVIEWYNTERLKIQDELKARHLTNEGNWLDPKKDRSGKTRTPASDGALAELERYYAWRKEMIEQARIEEGLTEEEFNRRIDVMEEEHMKKRSDLRVSFTTRDKKFIERFHKWWASVEELEEIDWQIIKDEWRAIMADAKRGDKEVKTNNMKAQKDLAAMERIVVKHLNAIDDILSKERPYDSITRNLQDNLTKMGILFADFDAEIQQRIASGETDVSMNAADEVLNRTKRIAFLLKESERAYSITAEDLLSSMYSEGFSSWADEIAHDDRLKQALMAQLRTAYDAIQDAIKKEASIIKKQAEIQWNDTAVAGGKSQKQMFEGVLSQLGLQEEAIKRANSLIGAGNASENVALRLSVKQMEIRLNMQAQYYALMRKIGEERASQLQLAARQANIESEQLKTEAARLRAEGRTEDAEQKERQAAKKAAEAIQASMDRTHVLRSLDLSTTQEQKKLDEQRTAIANQLEEIQNNTYKSLKEWADLLYSSLQSIFEASHAGEAEYYNELAKLNLTGKGGPGAGTYVVIENEGTEDAAAHYEYLDERQALERQREIERENAMAEAWKKVWDDLNMKMSEQITDWVNASLQNASVDANTDALSMNTDAIGTLTGAVNGLAGAIAMQDSGGNADGHSEIDLDNPDTWPRAMRKRSGLSVEEDPFNNTGERAETSVFLNPEEAGSFTQFYEMAAEAAESSAQRQIASIENVDVALGQHFQKQVRGAKDSDSKMASSNQSAFAKMTQAMNLYGVAYQAMSNENMSATQKFEMIAIQAAGQAAITALTTSGIKMVGDTAVQTPSVLTKIMSQLGVPAGPIAFGAFTALLGGLMGLAMSKLTKAKSQIASVTGAGSVGAGRLSTGMLTYAAGNVNEFTDPSTLTPGRQYNVDAADGKTYRARYMGRNPRTHLTNGPEFHLSGEKGKEMIIDAGTTRQITMNDNEIWRAIQTLSSGGRMRRVMKRGRGVPAFADGNVEDFEEMLGGVDAGMVSGMSPEQMAALQASIDRQSDLLDRALTEGIKGVFNVYGPDGLVSSYDQGKKTLQRHGERR